MADYVTLMGAEEVRSAANTMLSAASEMRAAASSIDSSLEQHRRFLDDWLQRFEAAVSAVPTAISIPGPISVETFSVLKEAASQRPRLVPLEVAPAVATGQSLAGEASPSVIAEQVRTLISDLLGIDIDRVTPGATFIDDLGADSLDSVQIVMSIEQAFGFEIPDSDAEQLLTVGDAISYVERAKGGNHG